MSERKVVNKYYPPDFDPTKLKIIDKKTNRKICNVRMMLPMTLKCYTCNQYMYIGTKFNMKVETVFDEDYLGIKIHRFYFKCSNCYSIITFKTDPKNNDYVAEWGASRNHEPWKDMILAEEKFKDVKKQEMKEDVMKSLEYRTYDSKREMDILDSIDQVKNLNKGKNKVCLDDIIKKLKKDENIYFENKKEKIISKFNQNEKKIKNTMNKEENSNDHSKDKIYLLNKKIQRNQNFNEENSIFNERIEKNNQLFKQYFNKDRKKKFKIISKH